jgi:hypothetical protein
MTHNPAGSTWKKWDLHVHTPSSRVHNYPGANQDEAWAAFLTDLEAVPSEFKAIGINDCIFIDGELGKRLRRAEAHGCRRARLHQDAGPEVAADADEVAAHTVEVQEGLVDAVLYTSCRGAKRATTAIIRLDMSPYNAKLADTASRPAERSRWRTWNQGWAILRRNDSSIAPISLNASAGVR